MKLYVSANLKGDQYVGLFTIFCVCTKLPSHHTHSFNIKLVVKKMNAKLMIIKRCLSKHLVYYYIYVYACPSIAGTTEATYKTVIISLCSIVQEVVVNYVTLYICIQHKQF